ncbi:MAG: hypothetical protein WC393_00960 [Candidatus Nanoarchaeia archaeon]|jgi:nucleoside phosphorylase
MKNICFLGAMSAELIYLENLLGKEKTSYKIVKDFKIIDVAEENVFYRPSKKLGLTVLHAYEKSTNIQVIVQNDYENNISVINTGVGLNNAYLAAKTIFQKNYDYFINLGTAGAIDETLEHGDILSIDTVLYQDDKNELFYYPLTHLTNFKKGGVLSCSSFVDNEKKKFYCNKFKELKLDINAVDMELYALREVIPNIISVKVISDKVDENNDAFLKSFPNFIETKYALAVEKILEKITS